MGIKKAIREMWSLEYEVDELQSKFADSIGKMDLDNLDVDFIEDMMLKSKPLQSVLNDIRNRQKAKLEDIKKTYGEAIKDREIMVVPRPAKKSDDVEPVVITEPEKAPVVSDEAVPAVVEEVATVVEVPAAPEVEPVAA